MGVSATGVGVANAATFTDGDGTNGTSTGTVNLEQDKDAKITLDSAPDLDFGTLNIGATTINAKAQTVTDKLQVSNPGLESGWNVTVSGTPFKTADGTKTLNGAVISLNGIVTPNDSDNKGAAPTTQLVKINDQGQSIFTAAKEAGIGTWLHTVNANDESAQLDIPEGNVAGSYTSDLTWTLSNAPA
jgi:hypothetical protein